MHRWIPGRFDWIAKLQRSRINPIAVLDSPLNYFKLFGMVWE